MKKKDHDKQTYMITKEKRKIKRAEENLLKKFKLISFK